MQGSASNRRGGVRVVSDTDCQLIPTTPGATPQPAELIDISLKGARVESETWFDVGDKCVLRILHRRPVDLDAVVVWRSASMADQHSQIHEYGLQLTKSWPLELFCSLAFPDQLMSAEELQASAALVPADWPKVEGYRLVRPIGKGGFGDVYEALAPGAIAKAVKRIPLNPSIALNIRELLGLRLARAIHHPFLLGIDRISMDEQQLIVVMELSEGTLRDEAESRRNLGQPGIPRRQLLTWLGELAEAVDYLTINYSVQHLDVKPENLFLVAGHLKLGDFGLMREITPEIVDPSANAVTPSYAAPEVIEGKVSPQSDQYALAVIYQELASGRRPYQGTDFRQIAFQHLTGKPDVTSLQEAEQPVILRALQRDPGRRYPTCLALIDALWRTQGTALFPSATMPPPTLANVPSDAQTLTSQVVDADAEIVNTVGMKMMLVSKGSFPMGAPPTDPYATANERPLHEITLRRSFYMASTPITQEQYEMVMGENPSCFQPGGRYERQVRDVDHQQLPVESVSWTMAIEFCNRISLMEGLEPYYEFKVERIRKADADGYRLPTEAEWEYACRAGSTTRWCFGDELERLEEFARFRKDKAIRPAVVGERLPNAFGLFDMHGNVHEWCWDWYGTSTYALSPNIGPTGPTVGVRRVLRGGSFYDPAPRTRSAARFKGPPWDRGANVGFRVVRTLTVLEPT